MKRKSIVFLSILYSVIMLWISCKKNHPPDTPTIACQAESGYANVVCDFSVIAFDPDEDSISYQFDWGNDDTSEWSYYVASGTNETLYHAWTNGGSYLVKARAQDQKCALSEWSEVLSFRIINNSPPVPSILNKLPYAWIGDTCTFTSLVIDLDNDSVAIRFDWDDYNISDWSDFMPSNETITMKHVYEKARTYKVKVQAKDIHGAISEWYKVDMIITEKLEWFRVTQSAGWSRCKSQVIFDNRIWVIGEGYTVWYSTNGLDWFCAAESAGWSSNTGRNAVVFDNKIWMLGGSDIRYSTDGVNWICATESAAYPPRSEAISVVFDNKMWLIGGLPVEDSLIKYRYINDVWYSADGVNWICATESAGCLPRTSHASVVYNNKIWVFGGNVNRIRCNDVWYSSDGVNWIRATYHATWSPRYGHTSVVFDNNMWVLGGLGDSYYNDTWYSNDGITWRKAVTSNEWIQRCRLKSVNFDNKIWILGGFSVLGTHKNDVWYGQTVLEKR